MRVHLNLATRPFANYAPQIRRLHIAMAVLALAAVALGAGLYSVHQQAVASRAQLSAVDARIAALNRERQDCARTMAQPNNALVVAQASVLNQLFDEKSFSWTLALEDLETVLPGGVQVTSLEPVRDKSGKITLQMRVSGARDKAVELVQNLERSKRFLTPRIVGESAETSGGAIQTQAAFTANSRVSFDLVADYNPVTAEEIREIQKKQKAAAASQTASVSARPPTAALVPIKAQTAAPPSAKAQTAAPVKPAAAAPVAQPQPANRPAMHSTGAFHFTPPGGHQ